ncbi:MAG: dihydroorotate dehydrogenase electron transfer subunit [Pirellulaceae bacterium]|nr:dihydroorotate dehydrogenase electron transfer subunit [Pirellulaceae bacterium]
MTKSLHAEFHADDATQITAKVLLNEQIARETFRLRIECPKIAHAILPGQFVMIRLSNHDDPLIGRPLALYETVVETKEAGPAIEVVYLVKGKFTSRLAELTQDQFVDVWGPLGNGFLPEPTDHLVMVAGGIGYTPFLALAQEYLNHKQYGKPLRNVSKSQKVTLCYGARSAEYFAGIKAFNHLGVDLHLSTDDGTRGHHGLVTDLLQNVLRETSLPHRIVCCGPEPMMKAVAEIAQEREISCQVSLETPMACGIGICFTCVTKVQEDGGGWDYKRTCVEGPVFDAPQIVW